MKPLSGRSNASFTAAIGAVFLLGAGEELWRKFLPKYLEALGAGTGVIGWFGTAENLTEASYQYAGGWMADHLGFRRAFAVFAALASIGYLIYLFSPAWPAVFAGLVFAMAWRSMGSPAMFSLIGETLTAERRAQGFTIQAVVKRVPMMVSPLAGGAIIATVGITGGVRYSLAITLGLAALSLPLLLFIPPRGRLNDDRRIGDVWRSMEAPLKRLLAADILIRACEGMSDVFIVLYVTNVIGASLAEYGALVAVQAFVSLLAYLVSARLAGRTGRKPFVIATFLCFAAYPVAVTLARGTGALSQAIVWLAFAIGGAREIGEPSRKALIVDLAHPQMRARTVGLYYLIRCLAISPAAALGGLLWQASPETPFYVAGLIGVAGTFVFAAPAGLAGSSLRYDKRL